MRYIPEQDTMQDALEKSKRTTYFKLTFPNTGNKLKVNPEQFLLHVHTDIHVCKQMGLDTNFANAEKAVTTAELDAKLAKMEYAQVCSSKKKKNKGNKSEGTIPDSKALVAANANHENVVMAYETANYLSLQKERRYLSCIVISSPTKSGNHGRK
jgi:hypothetical protein